MNVTWDVEVTRGGFRLTSEGLETDFPLGICGPSGAGKSTLLHTFSGLIRPHRGIIRLDGDVLCDTANGVWVPPHRRRVGLVFQDARLLPHLSVADNLAFGRARTPAAERRFEVGEVADAFGLTALVERRPSTLSGGERQRVALGRALLASPRVLLLDEPFASVDRDGRADLMRTLAVARERFRVPMILVSHDLDDVAMMCARMRWFETGRERAAGTVRDVLLGRAETHDVLNVVEFDAVTRDGDHTRCRVRESELEVWAPAIAPETRTATIAASDVSLSRSRVSGISIRNQFPGAVVTVRDGGPGVWVEVEIETGVRWIALVGREAADELGVKPGTEVWCLVKAAAVRPRF